MRKLDTPIYFFHIPKTAGTSLKAWLFQWYGKENYLNSCVPEELDTMTLEHIKQYTIYAGHFGFKLLEKIDYPCTTFTWLRDPVERTISNHFYMKEQFETLVEVARKTNRPSYEQYLFEAQKRGLVEDCRAMQGFNDNMQVRFLSGIWPKTGRHECTEEDLELAKQNLLYSMHHFGLSHFMSPSIMMLCEALKTPYRPLTHRTNTNSIRSEERRSQYSSKEIEEVSEINRFDNQLLQFARTEFENRFVAFWQRVVPSDRMANFEQALLASADEEKLTALEQYLTHNERTLAA